MKDLFRWVVIIFLIAQAERYEGIVWLLAQVALLFYLVISFRRTMEDVASEYKNMFKGKQKKREERSTEDIVKEVKRSPAYTKKEQMMQPKEEKKNPFGFLKNMRKNRRSKNG